MYLTLVAMQQHKGHGGSMATACAPSQEVEGSIPPVAVIIRLHPWLCRGAATELPIWGERSIKRWLRGQGQ